jgi:hypothetical protein
MNNHKYAATRTQALAAATQKGFDIPWSKVIKAFFEDY